MKLLAIEIAQGDGLPTLTVKRFWGVQTWHCMHPCGSYWVRLDAPGRAFCDDMAAWLSSRVGRFLA